LIGSIKPPAIDHHLDRRYMLLITAILGLLCAVGILGVIMQVGMFANLVAIHQNPEAFTVEKLLTEPAGVVHWVPTVDGGRLHTLSRGSGPSVVLLPDPGLSLVTMNLLWDRLAAYGYRVVTFDWRDHGLSQPGQQGLSLSGLSHDLDAVLRYYQLQQPLLVGHGTGAFMAFHYLLHRPELTDQVRGVVSIGGHAGGTVGGLRVGSLRDHFLRSRWPSRLLRHRLFGWGYVASAFGDRVSPALIRAYLEILRARPLNRLRPLLHELITVDLRRSLERFNVPTLVIASPDDQRISPHHAHDMAQRLPQAASSWIYRGAGNMLIWEQAPAVIEALREFDRNLTVALPLDKNAR
jgi:pimeloyl-ACP methyl ester carboxylesterase